MPSRAAGLLPWLVLLNALLMALIAARYADLRGAWRAHQVAAEAWRGADR